MKRAWLLLLMASPLGLGCRGEISDIGMGPGTGPIIEPPVMPPVIEDCAPAESFREMPRLSREEFRRSVEALFPVQETPETYELYPDSELGLSPVTSPQAGRLFDLSLDLAAGVAADPAALLGCEPSEPCVRAYIETQLPRVFRRPVEVSEIQRYVDLQQATESADGLSESLVDLVAAMLMSPEFLYKEERFEGEGELSPFELAARLSFLFWRQTPDDGLLASAANGALATEEGRAEQVQRLLGDERALVGYQAFAERWLFPVPLALAPDVEHSDRGALADSLVESIQRSVAESLQSGNFETLFTSDALWVDARLAEHFESPFEPGADGWDRIERPTERAGLLTHPALLAAHGAPHVDGRVIRRGVFFYQAMLCVDFPEPPDDAFTSGDTRTESPACRGCHTRIDPIGFAFEGFDSIGAPTDDTPLARGGEVLGTDIAGPFDDVSELSARLATSSIAQRCFSRAVTRQAMGRLLSDGEKCVADVLVDGVTSFEELMTRIVSSPLFLQRQGEVQP